MTPPRPHSNLAARMGRWSAAHWKTATFGWLAFVIVAFGLGTAIGVNNVDPNAPGPGESGRMDRILDDGFKQPADESVLIRSRSARAGTPAFDAAVTDVVARVSRVAAVQGVQRGAVAKDRHAALVAFTIKGDKDKAVDKVQPVLDAVAAAQAAHPGFTIGEFGYASAQKGVETAYGDDLGKAGALSLPITLLILVLAFGSLVAAGIPLLLALTAVLATFGLIALPSHLIPVAFEAPAMVLLIGLAVGVDYSMFYLKRERQERAAGKSTEAALEAAAATSGRSVLISGRDRDGGDGRHVPDRRPDLRVARLRHDPRRRGGGARLADRAARGALPSRRQRRPAARPVRRPAAGPTGRAVSGARSSIACCAGPPCRRPSRRACWSRWPCRRSGSGSRRRAPSRSRSR